MQSCPTQALAKEFNEALRLRGSSRVGDGIDGDRRAQPAREGFEVQVVADAGGSPSRMATTSRTRMQRGGVTLNSTNQLVAELVGNWITPEGSELVQVMETMQARRTLNGAYGSSSVSQYK